MNDFMLVSPLVWKIQALGGLFTFGVKWQPFCSSFNGSFESINIIFELVDQKIL